MSLYAIGDLHLHFQAQVKAQSQLHDKLWKDHEEKFRRSCLRLLRPDDTLLLLGDHSWGRNLAECEADLAYIEDLPGRKILLRGNHDSGHALPPSCLLVMYVSTSRYNGRFPTC